MTLYRTLRSLRDQERGIQPDAAWVRSARETLLMQVRNTMPTAEVAARYRIPFFGPLYQRIAEKLRGPVLAMTSIAGLVLGGSIASVSAAEQSLPGDTLFAVKLVTEQARLAFTGNKQAKVKLKAAFTMRRAEELKTIVTSDEVTEKDSRAGLAADVLKRDLDTLKQQLTDVQEGEDGQGAADAAKEVDKSAMEVAKTLAETKDSLSPEVKGKVADAQIQAANVGIQALTLMATAKTEAGDAVMSAEEIGASVTAHTEVTAQAVASAKALVGTSAMTSSTTSVLNLSVSSTGTLQLVKDAEASLAAVQQLASEQKLDEAIGLLKDASTKSLTAQTQAEATLLLNASASSTTALPSASTTSTPNGVASTSSTTSGVATSTTP